MGGPATYDRHVQVRTVRDDEREWLRATLRERWGGDTVHGRGRTRRPAELPAIVATNDTDEPIGLATYDVARDTVELVTIDALQPNQGVGQALLGALVDIAKAVGARRLQVMTTNDNLKALRLYQRAGFRLTELRPNAIDEARRIKTTIPQTGQDGIPIRDELDLELQL